MPERSSSVLSAESWRGGERPSVPSWLMVALLTLSLVGAAGFLVLLFGEEPLRAWRIFLVNFLFWNGAAAGVVTVAAIFEVSRARWPERLRGLAEACATYLVVSLGLFLVLCLGRHEIFLQSEKWHGDTAWWRKSSTLLTREGVALLLFCFPAVVFCRLTAQVRRQVDSDRAKSRTVRRLALALLFLFVMAYTLQAWDLVMALDPAWSSTLFGGFYFVSNLYLGLAFLTALAVIATRHSWLDEPLGPEVFANLGKLLLSFSLLWAYLVWSQYLVDWYGNLPADVEFVLLRTARPPWSGIAVAVLVMNALLPFLILLPRAAKRHPSSLLCVALLIATGIWLERFLLVAPSLGSASTGLFGWWEVLITAGFLASFAASWLIAIRKKVYV